MDISKLPPELQRAAELCEKATNGPWVRWADHSEVFCSNNGENTPGIMSGNCVAECKPEDLPDFAAPHTDDEDMYQMQAENNADFIAESRTALPLALTYCLQMQEERDAQKKRADNWEFTDEARAKEWIKGYEDERRRTELAEATIATLTRELGEAIKALEAHEHADRHSNVKNWAIAHKLRRAILERSAALSHTPEGAGTTDYREGGK